MTLIDDVRVDIGDDDGVAPSGSVSALHNLLSSTHSDTTPASATNGAIVRAVGTSWESLVAGTEGYVLTISGGVPTWSSGTAGPIGPSGVTSSLTLAQVLTNGNVATLPISWDSGLGAIDHLQGPADETFIVASASGESIEFYAGSILRAIVSPTGTQLINSIDINTVRDGGGNGTIRAGSGIFEYVSTSGLVNTGKHIESGRNNSEAYIVVGTDDYVTFVQSAGAIVVLNESPEDWESHIIKDATGVATATPIVVHASGGLLIDGASTLSISTSWSSYTFLYNGSFWGIV